jgi:hypothetical protein
VNQEIKTVVPFWYWVIAVAALLWNLLGCAAFAMEVFAQEAMMDSMIDSRLDLRRLLSGHIDRSGGKHRPVPAEGLGHCTLRDLSRGRDRPNGLHHDHCRRLAGNGTLGAHHALPGHRFRSGIAMVFVVRQASELV